MPRRWLVWAFLGCSLLGALALAVAAWEALVPLALGVGLAYAILPLVAALEHRGFQRPAAILTVYAGLGLTAAVVVLLVLPSLEREFQRLIVTVPQYLESLQQRLAAFQDGFDHAGLPKPLHDALQGIQERLNERVHRGVSDGLGLVTRLWQWALNLGLAPVLAYYLLRDQHRLKAYVAWALPCAWRVPVGLLLRDLDAVIGGFVRGQILLSALVGVLASLAAYLLGLRYSLLLGLWAGAAEFVPYIGPVLGAAPAVAMGLATSRAQGLQVLLAFVLIQQLEGSVIVPKIVGDSVGLHPLAVLLTILAGGYLGGIWGAILAIPAAGVILVLWRFGFRRVVDPSWADVGTPRPGLP